MIKAVIHIFGLPKKFGAVRKVEVQLEDKAGMAELVTALRKKFPELENIVIRPHEDRLEQYYQLNINGQFYFNDMDFELKSGDKISLIASAAGG